MNERRAVSIPRTASGKRAQLNDGHRGGVLLAVARCVAGGHRCDIPPGGQRTPGVVPGVPLDIEMPGMTGIEAAAALRAELPAVSSLIVTTFGRPGYVRRALDAGASGFVVKDTPARLLADAVRRVHQGLRVIDPDLAAESLMAGPSRLTAREAEILALALDGSPVSRIAARAHLSEGTVLNHLSAAIGKTGATTRAEAARVAQSNGWL